MHVVCGNLYLLFHKLAVQVSSKHLDGKVILENSPNKINLMVSLRISY